MKTVYVFGEYHEDQESVYGIINDIVSINKTLGGKLKNMVLSITNENEEFILSFPNTEIGYETTMNILSFDIDIEKDYEGKTYKEYYCFKVFSKLERFLKNKEMR